MIVDLCRASLIVGYSLLWLGLLVHAALHAYVMTWGDLYAMFRRVRARALRPGRVVLRRFRQRQRQHIGPVCRALFAPKQSPAPNPVARATGGPSDDAPRVTGSSAATGGTEPVVPSPRTVAAPGSALAPTVPGRNVSDLPNPGRSATPPDRGMPGERTWNAPGLSGGVASQTASGAHVVMASPCALDVPNLAE
jgi:hypothetical protein